MRLVGFLGRYDTAEDVAISVFRYTEGFDAFGRVATEEGKFHLTNRFGFVIYPGMNTENTPIDRDGGYLPNTSFNPLSLKGWKREFSAAAWKYGLENTKRQLQGVRAAFRGDWSVLRREVEEEKELFRFIWKDIKSRGRLSREILEGAGVKTVRELDAKRLREWEHRQSR